MTDNLELEKTLWDSADKLRNNDVMLTHHACYLIAPNGQSKRKQKLSFAENYFAM